MINLISICNLSNFCFFFLLLLFNDQIQSIVYVIDASIESVRQFVCTWNNVDYIIGIRLTFQFILDVISYCGFRATLFAKNRRRNSKQSNWNTCNSNVTKTSKRFHFFSSFVLLRNMISQRIACDFLLKYECGHNQRGKKKRSHKNICMTKRYAIPYGDVVNNNSRRSHQKRE